ncbi:DUF5666 domain-containing protein [Vibrio sp. E150_018]
MKKTILCLSVAALLSACGGSGSDNNSSDNANSYSSPEKLTGTVTEVSESKITVNGFELDASNAEVEYDETRLNLTDIQKGMRVDVETNRNGVATEIELDPSLVGEITAVNDDTITVNGTDIPTTTSTRTYSSAPHYQVGDWVLVDGYIDNSGQWQVIGIYDAAFIHNGEAEIEGPISSLNTANQTFYIGQTLISYAGAIEIDDDAPLSNGLWVEVEGHFLNTQFNAIEIEIEDDNQYSGAELEGIITWVNNEQTSFELNGRTSIAITNSTVFDDGKQSDLIEGAHIEVELVNGTSGLEATEIEFEDGSGSQTQSSVKFALSGTATLIDDTSFSINGYKFITDSRTQFEDRLNMASINNANIEIEGVESTDASGNIIYLVKEVEALEINDNEIDLEGSIENDSLWGYTNINGSFGNNGSRTDVECTLINLNTEVSNCRVDD